MPISDRGGKSFDPNISSAFYPLMYNYTLNLYIYYSNSLRPILQCSAASVFLARLFHSLCLNSFDQVKREFVRTSNRAVPHS